MMMMMTLGGYEAGSPQPWGGLARSSSPTAARPYSYISSHILSYLIISCHLFSFPLIFFLSLTQPSPLHCSNVSWNSISPLFFVFPWQSCTFPGLLFNFSKQPKLFLLCSEIASQAGEIIWTWVIWCFCINRQIANKMMLDLTLWHSNDHLWNPIDPCSTILSRTNPPSSNVSSQWKSFWKRTSVPDHFHSAKRRWNEKLSGNPFDVILSHSRSSFSHSFTSGQTHQQVNFFVPCWPATQEREPILVIVHWTMSRVRFLFPTRQF